MRVTIKITGSLRELLGSKVIIDFTGNTLAELINQLATIYGKAIKSDLLDSDGNLDYGYAIFVRGERLYSLSDNIEDNDELLISSAFTGG